MFTAGVGDNWGPAGLVLHFKPMAACVCEIEHGNKAFLEVAEVDCIIFCSRLNAKHLVGEEDFVEKLLCLSCSGM